MKVDFFIHANRQKPVLLCVQANVGWVSSYPVLMVGAVLIFLVAYSASVAGEAGCEVTIPVKEKVKLSAGIFDKEGHLVRSLCFLEEAKPPKLTLHWDGWSDFGEPVSAGKYKVRAVMSDVRLLYVMTIGNGIQPSDPKDHGGVHAGQGVAVDSNDEVYLVGQIGGESPKNLQRWSPEGKLLQSYEPVFGGIAVAVGEKNIYVLNYATIAKEPVGFVYRFDKKTGKQVEYAGNPGGVAPFPDPGAGAHIAYRGEYGLMWWRAHNLSLYKVEIFIGVPSSGSVVVMDAETGKLKRSFKVPGVLAVSVANDGRLYALTGNSLLRMDLRGKRRETVVEGLVNPYNLTTDREGYVYVLEEGRRAMFKRWGSGYFSIPPRILKFSPDGKMVMKLERRGVPFYTPADGRVEPTRFFFPTSVAVDSRGNIYVTEPALARVQKFDRNGRFIWSLNAIYAEQMCIDPKNPSEFYCTNGGWELRRYIIDYEKPSWRLDAIWKLKIAPGSFMTKGMRVARVAGKRFLALWANALFGVEKYRLRNFKLAYIPIILEDGTALLIEKGSLYRLKCAGFDLFGSPIYRPEDKELIARLDLQWNKSHNVSFGRRYGLVRGLIDEKGNFYVLAGERGKSGGVGYWQRHFKQVYLQKYDNRGRLLWNIGKHAETWAKPGEFYMPNRLNLFESFVCVTDVSGLLSIFERNGLMVAFLMKDAYRGFTPENDLYGGGGESWVSYIFRHPATGKIYYIMQDHGLGAFRLYEVLGLDSLRYWEGEVELRKAQERKPLEVAQKKRDFTAQIFLARKPYQIDGDLSDWSDIGEETLWLKPGDTSLPYAKLKFRYDHKFLYVAVSVYNDETPAVNKHAADRDIMWKGDCVEIYLGTDISAWRKGKYTENDYQFMLPAGEGSTGKVYCWTRHQWVEGSKVSFKINPDKKGYTLEAAIPFSYVKYKPKAGDFLPFDMRVMFGNPEGTNFLYNLIWSATNMAFNNTSEWGRALLNQFYAEQ